MRDGKSTNRFGSGFTLIEMLIVISIVGLLAVLAVSSYTRYRKASLVELAAQNVVSNLYEARDGVKYGRVGGGDLSMCRGLLISTKDDVGIQKITADFNSEKVFAGGKWVSGSCSADVTTESIGMDDLVKVVSVGSGEGGYEELSIWFMPPDAKTNLDGDDVITVLLQYGEDVETSFQRNIKINPKTGLANVENVKDVEK